MPSEKRQRQDAGRVQRMEAQRVVSKKQQRNRSIRGFGIVLALVAVAAVAIAVFTGGGDDDKVTAGSTTSTVPGEAVKVAYPGPGAKVTGDTPCPAADGSSKRTTSFEKAPPTCIKDGKTYTATPRDFGGRHHGRARLDGCSDRRQQLRGAGPLPLLRRRALPSDHRRLRRPVGHAGGPGVRRHRDHAGLHDSRRASRRQWAVQPGRCVPRRRPRYGQLAVPDTASEPVLHRGRWRVASSSPATRTTRCSAR